MIAVLSFFNLACVSVHGAGLAAFKEQPFHGDDLATIIVYSSIRETATTYQFDIGTKELALDRTKIAAYVTVPELPANLIGAPSTNQLRQTLAELNSFAARYKKSVPILKPYADQLKTTITRLEAGDVRLESKWLSSSAYAGMLQREQDARESVRRAKEEEERQEKEFKARWAASEAKRRAEMEKREAEKQRQLQIDMERRTAYAAALRSQGFEEYGGKWLPQSEVQILRQRDTERWKVENEVDEKSVRNMEYKVLLVTPEGLLVQPLDGDSPPPTINIEVIFLYGKNAATVAKGDRLISNVFWCGTRSFDTEDGRETIHAYTTSREDAIAEVRAILFPNKDEGNNRPGRGTEMGGTSRRDDPSRPLEGASGNGSGFFVGNGGYFVTNHHVVDGASVVDIYYDHKLMPARVIHVSKAVDLALLKVDVAVEGLPIVEEEMELGGDVIAVGYPRASLQGIEPKVTKGIISSKRGMEDEHIHYQIDAAIQPGNSGGPLCDVSGQVVGVIVATLARAPKGGPAPQNVNYAIKSSELAAFLRSKTIRFAQAGRSRGINDLTPIESAVKTVVAASALVVVRK